MTLLRKHWFALASGFICFLWAFMAWLTVIPNQDILADGIQAQSLISDPRIVLAFPGQKHGGPLEYPFTVLAEFIAPGNYFANAAIRPVLAFVTGFLVAKLFHKLFPEAPHWAFLFAIALGPTIIHGMLGPEGNPVGVWWLQPNWDMAWLLVTGGALIIATSLGSLHESKQSQKVKVIRFLTGGLLVGLGFFAHPAIILLIVPLAALVILRSHWMPLGILFSLVGAAIGVLPAAISYIVNAGVNTWDPSHGAFISVSYYRAMGGAVLGLDGVPDYMMALIPYGFGFAPSQIGITGTMQSAFVWLVLITFLVIAILTGFRSIQRRKALPPVGAVAVSWIIAVLTLIVFITFVDPVWIYSSGYSILFWLTVGALPSFFTLRWLGITVTSIVLLLEGFSTLTHNFDFYSEFSQRIDQKVDTMQRNQELAQLLVDRDVDVIFGSYYDAIPIGYASGMTLRTITSRYNRFPLSPSELELPSIRIAVNQQPTEDWGVESLELIESQCNFVEKLETGRSTLLGVYDCDPRVLDIRK